MKDLRELVAKLKALAWDDSGLCVDPDLDEIADELAAPPAETPVAYASLKELIERMRSSANNCMNSRDAGYVIGADKAEDWADELDALLQAPADTPPAVEATAEVEYAFEKMADSITSQADSHGHILKTCNCNRDTCPICSWGAGICSLCNAAEIELEQDCVARRIADAVAAERGWCAKHWPIGELGDGFSDFRCSCGATLIGTTQEERIVAWQEHIRAAPPADTWKQKAREWLEHEQKRMPGGPCSYFGVETVIDMLARFAAAPGEKGSKS